MRVPRGRTSGQFVMPVESLLSAWIVRPPRLLTYGIYAENPEREE